MAGSGEMKAYLTCLLLLYVKFTITILMQSLKSVEAGTRPLEDSVLRSLSSAIQAATQSDYSAERTLSAAEVAKAKEDEARWRRIIQNDLESVPLAMLLFGAGVFSGGNKPLFQVCVSLYTIARWFHTLAYASAKQPHRAIAFWTGVAATVVGAINSLVGVYRS